MKLEAAGSSVMLYVVSHPRRQYTFVVYVEIQFEFKILASWRTLYILRAWGRCHGNILLDKQNHVTLMSGIVP